MQRQLATLLLSVVALSAHAAGDGSSPQRFSKQDSLLQPAVATRLATRSVLVGITRAGDRLVAVGERGHILVSDDNARSWQQVKVPVSVTLTAVRFADAKNGWVVGHSGVILHTTDGGTTWRKQLDGVQANQLIADAARASGKPESIARAQALAGEGPDKPLLAVHFSDAQRGLAVGAYGMAFSTEDGGAHWTPVFDMLLDGDERHLYAIEESPKGGLYVAGEQGVVFRRATPTGHFEKLNTPFRSTLFDIRSASDGSLMALGLGGKLYRSEDQGAQWSESPMPGKASLTATVAWKDGVVLGNEAGQLLISTDQGRSVKAVPTHQPFPVSGLALAADGQLVVVGPRGVQAMAASSIPTN